MMESTQQSERETYRVIVLGQGGSELLLALTDTGFLLPSVEIPRWERLAANLTAAVSSQWGQDAICLFNPKVSAAIPSANDHNYQVMECHGLTKRDRRAEWVQVSSLAERDFADPADRIVVQQSLAECERRACHVAEDPFARLGWFRELQSWVEEAIEPLGFRLAGSFAQLNASPSFSLVRFDTSGPTVWFKAVGEPNLREFPITLALARHLPQYIPSIVATRPAWNGWLALETGGTSLEDTNEFHYWKAAAAALARLQLESIANTGILVEAGARELPCFVLSNLVRPFLSVMAQVMEEQPKVPPSVLSHGEIHLLGDQILEALSSLEEVHLPDALGHLDLNPGNVTVSDSRCVFLDWAEAYIGIPFLSFQYLREHFRRAIGTEDGTELELTTAYAAPWRSVISSGRLDEALSLAPLIAVFAYAAATAGWRDEVRLRDPRFAGYLRSLTRRMHREAEKLMRRSSPCLN